MDRFGFSKARAVALVAVLIVVAFVAVRIVQDDGQFPLVYVDVDELIDNESCEWTVRVTVRNDSDETVTVTRLETALDGQLIDALPTAYPTLEPGNTAVATGVWTLANIATCPDRADINHSKLIVHLDDGTAVSRDF